MPRKRVTNPKTLPEWQAYITTLSGAPLRSKALAANQIAFVRLLEADGLGPSQITQVYRAFAERLHADGQPLPSLGYLDYAMFMPG